MAHPIGGAHGEGEFIVVKHWPQNKWRFYWGLTAQGFMTGLGLGAGATISFTIIQVAIKVFLIKAGA